MTNDDDAADAATRLESALERIAQHARRPPPGAAGAADLGDAPALAARLDALIAQLRGVLKS